MKEVSKECNICKIPPILLGKRFMMPLLGHKYSKIFYKDIEKYLVDLDIEIVGSLVQKGWTKNDVDVVGNKNDTKIFAERLKKENIKIPVHYCGGHNDHSHIKCVYYGIKMAFTGKGY